MKAEEKILKKWDVIGNQIILEIDSHNDLSRIPEERRLCWGMDKEVLFYLVSLHNDRIDEFARRDEAVNKEYLESMGKSWENTEGKVGKGMADACGCGKMGEVKRVTFEKHDEGKPKEYSRSSSFRYDPDTTDDDIKGFSNPAHSTADCPDRKYKSKRKSPIEYTDKPRLSSPDLLYYTGSGPTWDEDLDRKRYWKRYWPSTTKGDRFAHLSPGDIVNERARIEKIVNEVIDEREGIREIDRELAEMEEQTMEGEVEVLLDVLELSALQGKLREKEDEISDLKYEIEQKNKTIQLKNELLEGLKDTIKRHLKL